MRHSVYLGFIITFIKDDFALQIQRRLQHDNLWKAMVCGCCDNGCSIGTFLN